MHRNICLTFNLVSLEIRHFLGSNYQKKANKKHRQKVKTVLKI